MFCITFAILTGNDIIVMLYIFVCLKLMRMQFVLRVRCIVPEVES